MINPIPTTDATSASRARTSCAPSRVAASGSPSALIALLIVVIAACTALAMPAAAGATASVKGTWVVPGGTTNTITWETVAGATEYHVYASTIQGTLGPQIATVTAPNVTYTHTGLTNGTSYYYTVRAFDGVSESTDPVTVMDTLAGAVISPARFFVNCNAVIDGKVYLFGGYDTAARNVIWQFDPIAGTSANTGWTMPAARYDCGADQYRRVAYLEGGDTDITTVTNQILSFTPGGNPVNTGFTIPTAMVSSGGVMLNGNMVNMGGHTACATQSNTISSVVSPIGANATNLAATLSLARSEGGIARIGNTAYYIGGDTVSCIANIVLSLTPKANVDKYVQGGAASAVAALPAARGGIGAASLNDMVFAFGGLTSVSAGANTIYRYDPRANTWTTLGVTVPKAGGYNTVRRIRGYLYVIAGYSGSATYGDVYRFTEGGQSRGVPAAPAAAVPTAPTATPGNTQVTVSWTAGAGDAQYLVWRSTTPGQRGQLIEESAGAVDAPLTSVVDAGLTNGTTYYYTISAVGDDDIETPATTQVSATPSLPGVVVSGTVYNDSTASLWTGAGKCDGLTSNISMSVNGAAKISVACNAVTGVYTFPTVTPAAGDTICVYIDGMATKAVTYTRAKDGTTPIANLELRVGYVNIRDESATYLVSNASIATYDTTNDPDILADTTAGSLTVSTATILVKTGYVFQPGASVTAPRLWLDGGQYTGGSETVVLNAGGVGVCSAGAAAMPFCVENGGTISAGTTIFRFTAGTTSTIRGNVALYDVDVNPSGATGVITPDGTMSMHNLSLGNATQIGRLTTGATTALTVTNDITLISGFGSITGSAAAATITVNHALTGNGTVSLTAGLVDMRMTAATGTLGSSNVVTWDFANLTFSNATGAPTTVSMNAAAVTTIHATGTISVGKVGDAAATTWDDNATARPVTIDSLFLINPTSTFKAPGAQPFIIKGDLTNNGTFTHNNGTVTLQGASASTFSYSAATQFFNVNMSVPSKTLMLDDTAQTNVSGTFTINGAACGTHDSLMSETPGAQAALNVTGATAMSFVDVGDIASTGAISVTDGYDLGNNTNVTLTTTTCNGPPNAAFVDDANAQIGSTRPLGIVAVAPHFSYANRAASNVNLQRMQVVNTPIDSRVKGLWHFDTATGNVADSSGNGFALSPHGSPTYPASQSGFSQSFTSTGAGGTRLDIGSPAALNLRRFTVDAWVSTNDISQNPYSVIAENSLGGCPAAAATCNYQLAINRTTTSINASVSVGGTRYVAAMSMAGMIDGSWHHVAMTVDAGNNLRAWLDGVPSAATVLPAQPDLATGGTFTIGRSDTGSDTFVGSLDDVRVSSQPLNATLLAGYYNTRRPHGTVMWDSDTTDTGVGLAVCANNARCADIVYGATGSPLQLVKNGAIYYSRAKFKTTPGAVWSPWGTWDYFGTTATLTVSTSGNIDFGTVLPNTDATQSGTVSVTSTNASGYQLTATAAADAATLTSGANNFPRWTNPANTPTNWAAGTAGYVGVSVLSATGGKDTARWGTGVTSTDFVNLNFAGLLLTTPTLMYQRGAYVGGTDVIGIGYRLNPASNQAAGVYTGTITYTILPNP